METLPEEIIEIVMDDECSLLMGMVSKKWYARLPPYGVGVSLADLIRANSLLPAYRACNGKLLLEHLRSHGIWLIDKYYLEKENTGLYRYIVDLHKELGLKIGYKETKYRGMSLKDSQLREDFTPCGEMKDIVCSTFHDYLTRCPKYYGQMALMLSGYADISREYPCIFNHILCNHYTISAHMYTYGKMNTYHMIKDSSPTTMHCVYDSQTAQEIVMYIKDNPDVVQSAENLDLIKHLLTEGVGVSESVKEEALRNAMTYSRHDLIELLK